MITQTELDELRIKLLPPGAERVLELLAAHRERVEAITVVMDKVPLLIIGRHGMIARLPMDGVLQKVSQTKDVVTMLERFFEGENVLYLFVNLPALQIPLFISQMLQETAQKYQHMLTLRTCIDEALDRGDRNAFLHYTAELRDLEKEDFNHMS
ncbi:IDEAL domain-containing protein [Sulfoacidibacillus thermotolerans]|uniref:IDEAL domain-containing protein n=1 Tax=Sulfoacidibacillus thermotolerans TaxID=1765684 RepID=A0A2U3D8Y7_SULT2|nr:IDEAL domain-containing protein [Sulfoacidibacillus thermotolerans]PWI57731.1 hypothetical protein BM613_07020 [Sulfoacidibacillus thermotolerans]